MKCINSLFTFSTSLSTRCPSIILLNNLTLLLLLQLLQLCTSVHPVRSSQLDHTNPATPIVQWNTNLQSPPGNGDMVQISPDNRWVYVTSSTGQLNKINPINGELMDVYTPPSLGEGGEEKGEYVMYGGRGLAFHDTQSSSSGAGGGDGDDGDESFLVYWIIDVPTSTSTSESSSNAARAASSRVIAINHDPNSSKLEVLWIKALPGTISGTPVIGSEGKLIYFTMNAPTASSSSSESLTKNPTPSPINSPVNTINDDETTNNDNTTNNSMVLDTTNVFEDDRIAYWWAQSIAVESIGVVCVKSISYPDDYVDTLLLFTTIDECCAANPAACDGSSTTSTGVDDNEEPQLLRGRRRRHLQTDDNNKSGKFIILSHTNNGSILYEFDSRVELSGIRNHNFGPVGIAHNPTYGNYNGGEENTHNVLMWGSSGRDKNDDGTAAAASGEALLFQLPRYFNTSSATILNEDTSQFRVRVMESVPWTTSTPPVFSSDGLNVYFAISENEVVGWNKGQKFDVVSNFGPVPLPFGTDGIDNGANRPIVLVENDDEDNSLLLVGSTDNYALFALSEDDGAIIWSLEGLGRDSPLTTPKSSPDGKIIYFGQKNNVHAVNVTDGTQLWYGVNGYDHPSNQDSDPLMRADFSLSSSGEVLYYSRSGSSISAIEVATDVPTLAPMVPTDEPSYMPSVPSSASPSKSVLPSLSHSPTISIHPTVDPNFIYPSMMPTETSLPSSSPSTTQSSTPSAENASVDDSSLPPSKVSTTTATVAPTPTFQGTWGTEKGDGLGVPSASPNSDNSQSSSSSAAEATTDGNENSSLGMTAIIGIAVGGGLGLILMLGAICYICKKKNEDDGVDKEWAQSNNNAKPTGVDDGTTFQYEVENAHSNRNNQQDGDGKPLQW